MSIYEVDISFLGPIRYGGRMLDLGYVHYHDVTAVSFQQAFQGAVQRAVKEELDLRDIPIHRNHYAICGGIYSNLYTDQEMRERVRVRLRGGEWIDITKLSRGGIHDKGDLQTQGTKTTKRRRREAGKRREKIQQPRLFD